ncbi:MAG: hypothetical protein EBZ48_15095 [Proteobacteria bacterium]|nr:hypothetical protein [Pseudomonadota bacterium]
MRLLTRRNRYTNPTREAIRKLENKGHYVVYSEVEQERMLKACWMEYDARVYAIVDIEAKQAETYADRTLALKEQEHLDREERRFDEGQVERMQDHIDHCDRAMQPLKYNNEMLLMEIERIQEATLYKKSRKWGWNRRSK